LTNSGSLPVRGREFVGFDSEFYEQLVGERERFQPISQYTIEPPQTAYGFSVEPGQVFRIVTVEQAQITDVCILSRDDPSEHYAAGTQLALEGSYVTRLTRIWGTAPRSRPLCTCIADSVKNVDIADNVRHHVVYSAHCNPHHWMLYAQRHPNTCYDNLRAGMAMVGLSQRFIHDNLNLFQKSGLDPLTGHFLVKASDAERGDHIEFFAETALFVVMSLCPYAGGEMDPAEWPGVEIPVYPLRVELLASGHSPKEWKNSA
jgi:uncharacterized protein YcgI (DUF1989 family)